MTRIAQTFARLQGQGRKALIPFITAGDPSPETTADLLDALAANGADIIELGIPFSDPMADGPVIQRASERALAQGMSLQRVLQLVANFRQRNTQTPIVLMGYANPIEAMGAQTFAHAAAAAGVDGVLVVDYPPEACRGFTEAVRAVGIDQIFLVAPTTSAHRLQALAHAASGYIYYVSLKGVTGAASLDLNEVSEKIQQLRQNVACPIGVGFGIRDAATAQAIGKMADGVVIGSRFVQAIESVSSEAASATLGALVKEFRHALDAVSGTDAV